MFIEGHLMPFPCALCSPWRAALRTFSGKARKAQKAETRDDGHAACCATPSKDNARSRPFSSRPGSSGKRVIRNSAEKASLCGFAALSTLFLGRQAEGNSVQKISQLHGKFDSLANLPLADGGLVLTAHPVELAEEILEVDGEKLLAKSGILACPRKIDVSDQSKFGH
jgi:hypothetical protein